MDFCFYWFTFIFALPRCESVRPNMPEIINLLKGFQMCEFPSEDWALAILRLTFNILTSYFKNGKLRKHVSLAGSCVLCPASRSPFYLSFSADVTRPATCLLHTHTSVKMSTQLTHTCAQTFCRTFRWKFNNSGETLDVGSERFSVNGSRSILKYTPVTDQVNTPIPPSQYIYIVCPQRRPKSAPGN